MLTRRIRSNGRSCWYVWFWRITGDAACAVIIDAIAEEEKEVEMKKQEA
ncbi:hypothetical protein [Moritella viscosa]|nr:hypothetical protein [Moritella viscosa]